MGFIFNQNAGQTPESIARQRKIAEALASQAMSTAPVASPYEGMARIVAALGSTIRANRADRDETAARKGASDKFNAVMSALLPGAAQPAPAPVSGVATPNAMPGRPEGGTFAKMLQIESGGNPNAVSSKGATGIAQIMPATARDPGFGLQNIFDFAKVKGIQVPDTSDATLQTLLRNPDVNAGFGEVYFNKMKALNGGNEQLAAASYNAGPGAVQKAGGVPNIPETQNYVNKLGLGSDQPQVQPAAYQTPPVPPAQQGPDAQELLRIINDPSFQFANPMQQKMVVDMFQRATAQAAPMQAIELQKAQLELKNLQNPQPEYDTVTGKDGSVFRFDKHSGKLDTLYGAQPEPLKPTADIQEYEYAVAQAKKAGVPQEQIPSFDQWTIQQKKAGASSVNIDQKAENAFDKKLAEGQAEIFNTMATEGMNARADIAVIDQLDGLLQNQGGTLSGIAGKLAQYGIGTDGMSDLQATQALINKLIPTQRQPGSGTMSDRDVEMFRASLPSLWNQPGGNAIITKTMRALAQYKQMQGDIAQRVQANEMNRQDAVRALKALPNPLVEFGKMSPKSGDGPAVGTIEDNHRFKGGDPADPNNWEPVQ
jgi:soluble lytic murein transglycosylase-like protein